MQLRHLLQSMTDFLLNDCWTPRTAAAAAPTPSAAGVVMATLLASLMTR